LLFGLCRPMWVSKLLINLSNPILELQHALLPPKCCEPRSVPQLFALSLFSLQIHIRVYQRAWECVTPCTHIMTTPPTSICKLNIPIQVNLKELFWSMALDMVDATNGNQVLFEHLMVDFCCAQGNLTKVVVKL